jgi:hypothetical protein
MADNVTKRRPQMDPADAACGAAWMMPTPETLQQILADRLEDDALEQLVCVYLQNRYGYLVRSRPPGAVDHGYLLRNAAHKQALVRARSRHTLVARDEASLPTHTVDHVFVFSPTNTYGPDPAPNVCAINAEDLIDFIRTESWSLPLSVSEWIERAADEQVV